jgi:Family of unknown function (DUF6495)
MKYRILNVLERKIFDEDFKGFLIVNGVSAEEWQEMNDKEVDKATELVELFSDIVLEKVYQKLKFIEFRSKDSCLVFECAPDQMNLISIVSKDKSNIDLSTPESIHEALVKNANGLSIFKTSKSYSITRELEIHQMIEQGCVASSKDFWMALEQIISDESE